MKSTLLLAVLTSAFLSQSIYAATGYETLSSCEQSVVKRITKSKSARNNGVIASLAGGAMAGGAGYQALLSSETLGESSQSSSYSAPTPTGKLIFSAISSGATVTAISMGAVYLDYRAYVDNAEGLLLLFKDVKNNGMGPEIELRAKVIQQILKEFETGNVFTKLFKKSVKYNPETYNEDNVTDEIINVSNQYITSSVVDCSDTKKTSENLDKKVINNLIQKYNPQLKLQIK
jgi:hypothetical protein